MSVQVKARKRTVSNRRVRLRRDCSFRSTVTFHARKRLGRGLLTFRARFSGNRTMYAQRARARHARAG